MDITDKIGFPATLEQCAEECSELAQVCLKMARKLRDENPTPKSIEDIIENLNDETADVLVCIDELIKSGILSKKSLDYLKAHRLANNSNINIEHAIDMIKTNETEEFLSYFSQTNHPNSFSKYEAK